MGRVTEGRLARLEEAHLRRRRVALVLQIIKETREAPARVAELSAAFEAEWQYWAALGYSVDERITRYAQRHGLDAAELRQAGIRQERQERSRTAQREVTPDAVQEP